MGHAPRPGQLDVADRRYLQHAIQVSRRAISARRLAPPCAPGRTRLRATGRRAVSGQEGRVASYSVNPAGVAWAERLIDSGQYVLSSDWGKVQTS
jgi:hypothetical protein